MDNLKDRLRAWAETPNEGDPMIDALLADVPEAADRIERLEKLLGEARDVIAARGGIHPIHSAIDKELGQ